MAQNRRGKQSIQFIGTSVITHWASVAGKKEGCGPLKNKFDLVYKDAYFGEKTWEQGEKKLQQLTLQTLVSKANLQLSDIDLVCSGDLLNQCIGSSFCLRNQSIPHLGLYGACSTMAESLTLAAMTVEGGYADHVVAMTSSHFASSERQYRFPLGYGGQRTPTAQWTVTGSGAALVCANGVGPVIESATIGTVTDLGIKDANNMGAAMAPAAFNTIRSHFDDLSCGPEDFDMIVTGDLGELGSKILHELFSKEGISIGRQLNDCGIMIFDNKVQDVHAGGSGCGCSAITLCSDLLNRISSGNLNRILFCGTGALLSPTSTQQGLPIPGICHAVCIKSGG
jgi:stage V sporulation protein AD